MHYDIGGYAGAGQSSSFLKVIEIYRWRRILHRLSSRRRRDGEREIEQRFILQEDFEERQKRGEIIPESFRVHVNKETKSSYVTGVEIPSLWMPKQPGELTFSAFGTAALDVKRLYEPSMVTILLVVSQEKATERLLGRPGMNSLSNIDDHLATNAKYDHMNLKKFYDYSIDTTELTIEEVVKRIELIVAARSRVSAKRYLIHP